MPDTGSAVCLARLDILKSKSWSSWRKRFFYCIRISLQFTGKTCNIKKKIFLTQSCVTTKSKTKPIAGASGSREQQRAWLVAVISYPDWLHIRQLTAALGCWSQASPPWRNQLSIHAKADLQDLHQVQGVGEFRRQLLWSRLMYDLRVHANMSRKYVSRRILFISSELRFNSNHGPQTWDKKQLPFILFHHYSNHSLQNYDKKQLKGESEILVGLINHSFLDLNGARWEMRASLKVVAFGL